MRCMLPFCACGTKSVSCELQRAFGAIKCFLKHFNGVQYDTEALEAIAYMRRNYAKNTKGCVYHLCLAVCAAERPQTILGWCGLDGTRSHTEPELFILLDEPHQNKGCGTQCVKMLLRIAAEDFSLESVHGGCAKDNLASRRVMEKGGMVQYGTEENGDPLFRHSAQKNGVT